MSRLFRRVRCSPGGSIGYPLDRMWFIKHIRALPAAKRIVMKWFAGLDAMADAMIRYSAY